MFGKTSGQIPSLGMKVQAVSMITIHDFCILDFFSLKQAK